MNTLIDLNIHKHAPLACGKKLENCGLKLSLKTFIDFYNLNFCKHARLAQVQTWPILKSHLSDQFYHLIILDHHLINPVICNDFFWWWIFFQIFGNFWEKKWFDSLFFNKKSPHLQARKNCKEKNKIKNCHNA